MTRVRNPATAIAVIASTVLVGCGAGGVNERHDPPQAKADSDTTHETAWTAGILDQAKSDAPVSTLVAARTTTHDGFDRVVFEFAEQLPGYHTEYIDRPVRKCGSGKVTQMAGDGWLEVRMDPAKAHTSEGQSTVAERERMLNLPVLSELELTCDFEGVVTWVFGVESPNRYRVRELSGPPRLVVDIKH